MQGRWQRRLYDIRGIVQGVGFRPAICRLAMGMGLGGWVRNCSARVELELEGEAAAIDAFLAELPQRLPPQARIEECSLRSTSDISTATETFVIKASLADPLVGVTFPADLVTCAECLRDLTKADSRWHLYPFTTCTNCGPRYTVISDLPYDRQRTTLKKFPLCSSCVADYNDPLSRRFHAESIACPECGPRVFALDSAGAEISEPAIPAAQAALRAGRIVALRGIGGFLLAVDAFNSSAIAGLRERKTRPHKPLAVMARSLAVVERFCEVPQAAAEALASSEGPIVILDLKAKLPPELPWQLLSPDSCTLGVMLPNSPLQHLLFMTQAGEPLFDLLVMTSGNQGGEPICLGNEEARQRLGAIADLFLCHDREINLRADDSLAVLQGGRLQLWRRGRGYAPGRLLLPRPLLGCTLALGAELKNSAALGLGQEIVMSAHIGDLESPGALLSLKQVAEYLPSFLRVQPERVAVDLHPDMHSTRLGRSLAKQWGVPLIAVPHHQAHAAAVLAEHGCEEGLVLVFDGTGLGTDGSIWGAELLEIEGSNFRRLATFRAASLPGGDVAVREPQRQLVARLALEDLPLPQWLRRRYAITEEEECIWRAQACRGINAPLTHAAGRLFDSLAVLLGVAPQRCTYDGQSAVRVEDWARRSRRPGGGDCPFVLREEGGLLQVDWQELFRRLPLDPWGDEQIADHAWAFHEAVAAAAFSMLEYALDRSARRTVAATGGVFMNRLLVELLEKRCESHGLKILWPWLIPPNDGGIAVGQAVVAGALKSPGINDI